MARGGVSFELERFGWVDGSPLLEVAGRWRGPRRRRLGAATLAVDAGGRRRLQPSASTGDVRADPEPELWRAEFLWTGGRVLGAELEVGSSLVIELPVPDGSPPDRAQRPPAEPSALELGRLELSALRRQSEADRAESERLRLELAPLRADAAELERVRAELAAVQETAEREAGARAAAEEAARRDAEAAEAARADADARERRAREETRTELRAEIEAAEAEARTAAAERDAAIEAAERRAREVESERDVAVGESGAAFAAAEARAQRAAEERDAARADAQRLQAELSAALNAIRPSPADPPAAPREPEPEPEIEHRAAPAPYRSVEDTEDTVERTPPSIPPPPAVDDATLPVDEDTFERLPAGESEGDRELDAEDETQILDRPPRRGQPSRRPRPAVVPHRTAPATRRLAERPPKDSPALRAVAAALLLLLVVVLVILLIQLA